MHHDIGNHFPFLLTDLLFGIPAMLAILFYFGAVLVTNRRGRLRKWPWFRTVSFFAGVFIAAAALVGPLSRQSHADFTAHMAGHLLLGMLAPLLIALSAPMTLVLRTLNVHLARKLSRLLQSPFVSFYTNPIVASVLEYRGLMASLYN